MTDLAPGSRLGPYEVLSPLGAGGMGQVWRARDTRLERDVALKVLRPGLLSDDEARRRFRKEALALAKLKHAHIAYIHDLVSEGGTDALVMELVEGETLSERLARGPLREDEVVRIGRQLSDGLSAAHAQGVIHCDLKPGNLKVTPDGDLKILDFGLAHVRRAQATQGLSAAATESAMAPGVFGTLPYMAPEQLRAEPLDARTDVWAAGVVLCELATGRRPFEETVPARLTDAILHADPPSLSGSGPALSSGLKEILKKCLRKDASERYESVAQLRAELEILSRKSAEAAAAAPGTGPVGSPAWPRRRIAVTGGLLVVAAVAFGALWRSGVLRRAGGGGRIDSLAVLPLSNISKDPEQEYFADGMTEALIAELSRVRALKVISRTSVMQYKNAKQPLPEIARALGVRGVVEGSVMREGDSVRITVQLIDADSDRHLWAESYTREAKNVLALQSEVATAIAREVRVAVTPEEAQRLAAARPVDPEAHRLVLLGMYAINQNLSQRPGIEKGIEYFRKALEIDPQFALAHARLAYGLTWMGWAGYRAPRDACPEVRAELEKALALDPHQPDALTLRGNLRYRCDHDWAGGGSDLRRAVELAPGSAFIRSNYASYLAALGRFDEALAETRTAEGLDPLSEQIGVYYGIQLAGSGRTDDAIRHFRRLLSVYPDSVFAKYALGNVLTKIKRYDEAIEIYLSRKVANPGMSFTVGVAYGLAGRKTEASNVLEFLLEKRSKQYVPADQIAFVYGALGEMDTGFEWLDRAFEERSFIIEQAKTSWFFDPFRRDPRFEDLVRKLRYPS